MILKRIMPMSFESLKDLGELIRKTRENAGLTQEQVARRADISRPRYREIEAGQSAARANTLMNIARALSMELMLVPQAMVPAIGAMLRSTADDDRPAFMVDPVDDGQGS